MISMWKYFAFLTVLFICPLLFYVVWLNGIISRLLCPKVAPKGEWVAEVYRIWYFGKGQNMYRARFSTQKRAERAAKIMAVYADRVMPTKYIAQRHGLNGLENYYENHEYGIGFSVCNIRYLTPEDRSYIFNFKF